MSIAERTFEFVGKADHASSMSALNRAFCTLMAPFGGERWAAVRLSSRPTRIEQPLSHEFGDPPVEWQSHYRQQNYAYEDLAALETMRRNASFFLSDLAHDPRLTPRGRHIMGERAEFGFGEGVVSPVRLAGGSVWGVCWWGPRLERDPALKSAMSVASQAYVTRVVALAVDDTLAPTGAPSLTLRMRTVLERLRSGQTQVQIARELGVSVRTIENVLREARERLRAPTTAALLAIAIARGEIASD